ncbi:uncharacterized protein LOC122850671 [Aphidius gifuensis]|uniref:uncharacterized protein LOC122850671 n=1 Tax=Aphidius gifuensis TaxID=684658 RepID=UPI001CDC0323|nr:uncharacterized protein LOC122850671 [Aphidius gifuensis]
MIVYKNDTEELKKIIIHGEKSTDDSSSITTCQSGQSFQSRLKHLFEDLHVKETDLKKSHSQMQCAEKLLNFIELNKTNNVDRYKNLLAGLRNDFEKTENEVKFLQNEITNLSRRREILKNDII